jgi:hypothetical protein
MAWLSAGVVPLKRGVSSFRDAFPFLHPDVICDFHAIGEKRSRFNGTTLAKNDPSVVGDNGEGYEFIHGEEEEDEDDDVSVASLRSCPRGIRDLG